MKYIINLFLLMILISPLSYAIPSPKSLDTLANDSVCQDARVLTSVIKTNYVKFQKQFGGIEKIGVASSTFIKKKEGKIYCAVRLIFQKEDGYYFLDGVLTIDEENIAPFSVQK